MQIELSKNELTLLWNVIDQYQTIRAAQLLVQDKEIMDDEGYRAVAAIARKISKTLKKEK